MASRNIKITHILQHISDVFLNVLKRMTPGNSRAFTIIEVMLFLAISSGMVVIALNGLRGRNEAVQFNQGMRAIESTMQEQLNLVSVGQYSSGTPCPYVGTDCILLGRVIEFTPGSSDVKVHVVVGAKDVVAASTTPATTLAEAQPRIIYTEDEKIQWGVTYAGGYNVAGLSGAFTENDIRLVGFLRLPGSTDIIPISYATDALLATAQSVIESPASYTTAANSSFTSDFSGSFCFVGLDGDYAQLDIGEGSRKLGIELQFNNKTVCS